MGLALVRTGARARGRSHGGRSLGSGHRGDAAIRSYHGTSGGRREPSCCAKRRRDERERPELSAIALTTDSSIITAVASEFDFSAIFSRQVRALGSPGDVLLVLSIDGNSANVLAAIDAAHERDMVVVGLSGHGGGKMAHALRDTDVHICVPHDRAPRVQEVHILALHCICDAVDAQLLGDQENPL